MLWFSLSDAARKEQFGDTARAAEIAGVSRRTIQKWIELGQIASVPIGKRHQVHLDSLRHHLELHVDAWEAGEM